jgi:lactate permease
VASAVAGIVGMAAIALLSRTPLLRREPAVAAAPVVPTPVGASSSPGPLDDEPAKAGGKPMSFHLGFMPYYLLITLSIISQIGPIKEAVSGLAFGLDYPGFTTGDGFTVAPVVNYATIRLLNHPAPLIVFSVLLSMLAFTWAGHWKRGVAWESLRLTYAQSISTTVGVGTMVMMAVIMADMGMTTLLAQGIANASGPVFPLVAPFIGLLGAFMTGSNTNSNVMFGVLQVETAETLGIGKVTIASIHSIGGSIGSSMAPAKVFLGAAIVGLANRENEVMRIIVPYVVGMVLLAGIEAMVLVKLIPSWTR